MNETKELQSEVIYHNRDKREILTKDYTQVSNEIIRSGDLTGEQKIVYIILRSFNPSFPSLKQLSDMTGFCRTRLIALNKSLRALGLIDWSHRYNNSNRYVIYDTPNEAVIEKWNKPKNTLKLKSSSDKHPSVHAVKPNNTKITLSAGDNNKAGCSSDKQLKTDCLVDVHLLNNSDNQTKDTTKKLDNSKMIKMLQEANQRNE